MIHNSKVYKNTMLKMKKKLNKTFLNMKEKTNKRNLEKIFKRGRNTLNFWYLNNLEKVKAKLTILYML